MQLSLLEVSIRYYTLLEQIQNWEINNLQEQVRKVSLPRAGIAVWPVVHSIDAYRESYRT